MMMVLVATSLWAKNDDEVIVTRQLTMAQRKSLPNQTISLEMKRLVPNKKAEPGLIDAINQVMDTIANEDFQNRTFVLLIEPKPDGDIAIAAHSDDILSQGHKDASMMFGDLQSGRCHFVVLVSKDNFALLEQTFKRKGKVKFVQEFELVEFKTPYYPTNVIGQWSADKGLRLLTVIINEDPNADRDSIERPARIND
jgi:hypothetical protein